MIFIHTASGISFSLDEPNPDLILIEDIASSLANQCRFTGHTCRHYSVAEHSLNGCRQFLNLNNAELAFEFLLHDAHEAYVGDMSSPLKELVPAYCEISDRFELIVRRKFGLPDVISEEVKEMDARMLSIEQYDLMGISKDGGASYAPIKDRLRRSPDISPTYYRNLFLHTFTVLSNSLGLGDV